MQDSVCCPHPPGHYRLAEVQAKEEKRVFRFMPGKYPQHGNLNL